MMAAHLASEAALRLVKPGNDNSEVRETLNKVAESFECKTAEGIGSTSLSRTGLTGTRPSSRALPRLRARSTTPSPSGCTR